MIQPFMYDIKQLVSTFSLVLAVMESRISFIMVALVMFPLAVSADDVADALNPFLSGLANWYPPD